MYATDQPVPDHQERAAGGLARLAAVATQFAQLLADSSATPKLPASKTPCCAWTATVGFMQHFSDPEI